MRAALLCLLLALTIPLVACDAPLDPTFEVINDEVFASSCAFSSCHDADAPEADLDLSSEEAAWASLQEPSVESTMARVVAGDPDNSLLLQALLREVDDVGQMPPGVTVPDRELDAIRQWIEDGASQ